MLTTFYSILFWLYWGIDAFLGVVLLIFLFRERSRGAQATAAMLLVPVALRMLLIK